MFIINQEWVNIINTGPARVNYKEYKLKPQGLQLNRLVEMNQQTQMTPINVQILQSLLYSLQKDIPKIQVTLQFDDEQKYLRFINKYNPIANDDEDVVSNSEDQEEEEPDTSSDLQYGHSDNQTNKKCSNSLLNADSPQKKPLTIQQYSHKHIQKLSRLQQSIILKQNYQKQIQKISMETKVKILIVPEKLKFFGQSEEAITEAKSQVHDITTNIMISTLQRYGREVYESDYVRKLMQNHGIHMGKVAQKYYYWYDQALCNEKVIEEELDNIFNNYYHRFAPLIQNYQLRKTRYNKAYIDAITATNGQLYLTYLDSQLNDPQYKDHKIQLSRSKNQIIIHVKVKQQAVTIQHEIQNFFKNIIQFFVQYKTEEGEEIENIAQIQTILNQRGILWYQHGNLLVINYYKNGLGKVNQSVNGSNINVSTIMASNQAREKEFLQNIKPIFQLNPKCYIQILQGQSTQQIQEQLHQKIQKIPELNKKITIQFKKYDGVLIFSPKNQQRINLFLLIIQHLIIKPKLNQQKPALNESLTVNKQVEINMQSNSNFVNDTTSMIDNTMEQADKSVLNVNESKFKKNGILDKSILGEIRDSELDTKILDAYRFCIIDPLGDKKYQEDIDEIKKGKGKFPGCQQIEKQLQQQTQHRYKPYLPCLPERYRRRQPATNPQVTVFLRQSDKQYLDKQVETLHVYLLRQSKTIVNNGWLLNVDKDKLIQGQHRWEIPKGMFEIVMWIKFID